MPRAQRIPDFPAVKPSSGKDLFRLISQPRTPPSALEHPTTEVVTELYIPSLLKVEQYRRREKSLRPTGISKTVGDWLKVYARYVETHPSVDTFEKGSAPWNTHYAVCADAKRGPAEFFSILFERNHSVFKNYDRVLSSPSQIRATLMSRTTRPEDIRNILETAITDLGIHNADITNLVIPEQRVRCSDTEITSFLGHAWYAIPQPSPRNQGKYSSVK